MQYLAKFPVPELIKIDLTKMPNNWMLNTWILPLFKSLQTGHLTFGLHQFSLTANQFFPGSTAPEYIVTGCNYNPIQHAEAAVMSWLQFCPWLGMTLHNSRALAILTSVLQKAFHGSNFLYLDYVQRLLKNFRLHTGRTKMPQTTIEWQDLAQGLKDHLLASPTSGESLVLETLKEFLCTVSSLPLPQSTEMFIKYQEAVKVGGDAGVQIFAPFIDQMYISLVPSAQPLL